MRKYRIKIFATHILIGIALLANHSCKKNGEIKITPTVVTTEITEINFFNAVVECEVTNDGGLPLLEQGICWSTTSAPTIDHNKLVTETSIGKFTIIISGLSPGTTYYVRAYATNNLGTSYGEEMSFTTESRSVIHGDGVADIDGNEYRTVIIGDQEWMAENLMTTRYNNGTIIPNVTNDSEWISLNEGAYCWYENNKETWGSLYGALYNLYTIEMEGLCPEGWRIPTNEDWDNIIEFLYSKGFTDNYHDINGNGNALKSYRQVNSPLGNGYATNQHPRWNEDNTTGHYVNYGTDSFGFSALPAGFRSGNLGTFNAVGEDGAWWCSTSFDTPEIVSIYYGRSIVYRLSMLARQGVSVRCIKSHQ